MLRVTVAASCEPSRSLCVYTDRSHRLSRSQSITWLGGRSRSLGRLWPWNLEGPRETEHCCVSLSVSNRSVLMLELEEDAKIPYWKNVVGLKTDGMDRVSRDCASGQNGRADGKRIRDCAAVRSNLPLVVADEANLQELTEILFDGKNLADAPFVREGLPRGL